MADTNILPPEEQRLVLRLLSYWRELAGERPMPAVDDIDGTAIQDYRPYSAVTHFFTRPGIYVVTVTAKAGALPVTQKVKVMVQSPIP